MMNTIVLIHGMFQNHERWKHWIGYFEAKVYRVISRACPLHEGWLAVQLT